MPTKTKPIRSALPARYPIVRLDQDARDKARELLGIDAKSFRSVLPEIESALSEGVGRIGEASIRPLPAHVRAELDPIIKLARKICIEMEGLSGETRKRLYQRTKEDPVGEAIAPVDRNLLWAARDFIDRADRTVIRLAGKRSTADQRSRLVRREIELEDPRHGWSSPSQAAATIIEAGKSAGGKVDQGQRPMAMQVRRPMRTALVEIYERNAVKPTERKKNRFLKILSLIALRVADTRSFTR